MYYEQAISKTPLGNDLTETEVVRLTKSALVRILPRKEVVIHQGTTLRTVLLLYKGTLKFTRVDIHGNSTVLDLHAAPSLFGAHQPNDVSFETIVCTSDCVLLSWDYDFLVRMFPTTQRNLLLNLVAQLRPTQVRLHELIACSVPVRVARFLHRARGEVLCTKEEMASMIGTTMFSVSRVLAALQREGIVRRKRLNVEVLQRDALERKCHV